MADMHQKNLFQRFAPAIRKLPQSPCYTRKMLLTEEFHLAHEDKLEIYYAPFDYINRNARVVLIGVTPGWQQMELAYRIARQALNQNIPPKDVCRKAKSTAAFAGAMRSNLCAMLDKIKLPDVLDLSSSISLFDDHAKLLHTTSALRYPVFATTKNYTGHQPKPLSSPLLKSYIKSLLGPELATIEHALIIPLGKAAQAAIEYLVDMGVINSNRCCLGFPHPSGANAHRAQQFYQNQKQLQDGVEKWAMDFRLHS